MYYYNLFKDGLMSFDGLYSKIFVSYYRKKAIILLNKIQDIAINNVSNELSSAFHEIGRNLA